MKTHTATRLLAGGALGLAASVAWAQADPPPRPEGPPPRAPIQDVFKQADTNGDGKVSLEDIRKVRPGFPAEAFQRHDRDKDGVLTKDELPRGRGPGQGPRDGRGPRDGAGPDDRPRGEVRGLGEGPRDGRGPRDGAGPDDRPRGEGRGLGEGPRDGRGPRDGAGPDDRPRGEGRGAGAGPRDGRGPGGPGGPMGERMRAADTNNDGKITWEEMSAAFPEATRERFDRMDTNGDGVLSPADRPPRGEGPGPEGGPRGPRPDGAPGGRGPGAEGGWFQRLDVDKDGKVSQEEYLKGAPNATEERFKRLDTDGDGYVTPAEMRAAWAERRGNRPAPAPDAGDGKGRGPGRGPDAGDRPGRGPGRGPDGAATDDDKGAKAAPDWNAVRAELIAKHGSSDQVDYAAIAAAKPGFPQRTFERLDTNGDGVLSAADEGPGGRGAMARQGKPDRPRRAAD